MKPEEIEDDYKSRLDDLFYHAFEVNHPAMHDYSLLKIEMKRLHASLEAAQREVAELREILKEVLEALRIHAPGTPLNNHRFDALGIKAYAALARTEKEGGG